MMGKLAALIAFPIGLTIFGLLLTGFSRKTIKPTAHQGVLQAGLRPGRLQWFFPWRCSSFGGFGGGHSGGGRCRTRVVGELPATPAITVFLNQLSTS